MSDLTREQIDHYEFQLSKYGMLNMGPAGKLIDTVRECLALRAQLAEALERATFYEDACGPLNEANVRLEKERDAAIELLRALGDQMHNEDSVFCYRECAYCGGITDENPEPEEQVAHTSDCALAALLAERTT